MGPILLASVGHPAGVRLQITFCMTGAIKCDILSRHRGFLRITRWPATAHSERKGMAQHSPTGAPERFPTVLVVDDDADLLNLCAVYLGAAGFSMLRAAGSTEAQEICDTYPAKLDLILLDVMLYPPDVRVDHPQNPRPRLHGDKLLSILRVKRPLTRLMLMSASSPWKLGGRGMSGVLRQYPFIQKPFTKEFLVDKVREVLASPMPARPASFGIRPHAD